MSKYITENFDRELNKTSNNVIDIASINKYKFVREAYEGTGGFRNGKYLFPHVREKNFIDRRKESHYNNRVSGIVDSRVDPVFSSNPSRTIVDGDKTSIEISRLFVDNCDNAGSNLSEVIHNALLYTRMHGVSFIVMDNFDILYFY